MQETEITKVQLVVREFLFETRGLDKDPQKAAEWLSSFRDTLLYHELAEEPNGYALELIDEARGFSDQQRKNAQLKQARRALADEGNKKPTREEVEAAWRRMYEGDVPEPQEEPKAEPRKPAPVPAAGKEAFGTFGNVMLTHEEASKWFSSCSEASDLVEELSSYLASSGKRYKSHYATLLNWQRRKSRENATSRQRFKTSEDISRENYDKSLKLLEQMEHGRKDGTNH